MKKFGGIYKYLNEDAVLNSFIAEIEENKLHFILPLFREAWQSEFWKEKGYDGASVVQDEYHPRLANFIHDYLYRMGMGGIEADIIYRELLILTGTKKSKAYTRYYAIRTAWITYFKWKHLIDKNVNPISKNAILVFDYLN